MEVLLLGPLVVRRDGEPVDLGTPKQRAVLALLALERGRVVAVDRLLDALWGDAPPAKAVTSLHAYIANLRRLLEPDRERRTPANVLVTAAPGYALQAPPDAFDVVAFEALAEAAAAALAHDRHEEARSTADDALALWRGPLLLGLDEPVFAPERVRLDELRAGVEEDRVAAALGMGRHAQAIAEAEALVARQPLRERSWGLLLRALHRAGRAAEALERYQQVRGLLDEELGIDPGPELVELHQAILRRDPGPLPAATTPAAPRAAAAPVSPDTGGALVGRDAELGALAAALDAADTTAPWVVVGGPAGIGKTRLAEEAAAQAARRGWPVAWAAAPQDEDAPAFWLWSQVLAAIGADPPPAGGAAPAPGHRFVVYEHVAAALQAVAPLLVVLDDLQWADTASLRLAAHLAGRRGGSGIVVVATVRDGPAREGAEELREALARRAGVTRLELAPLSVDEVAQLARSMAAEDLDAAAAAALHERSDGNPFVAGELLRLPAAERATALPGPVRDVVARRIARLPPAAADLLALAAVAGQELDADVLAAATGVDIGRALDLLDAALAARLLLADEDGALTVRFAHALVRETLLADLSPVARRRHHAALAAALAVVPARDAQRRTAELAHHRVAALPLGDARAAVDAALAAAEQATAGGGIDEAVRWAAAAQRALESDAALARDDALRGRVLVRHGSAVAQSGDGTGARPLLVGAARAAADAGDGVLVLHALIALVRSHGGYLWVAVHEDPSATLRELESIGEQLPEGSAAAVALHATLAAGRYYVDPAGCEASAVAALNAAEQHGAPAVRAQALLALATSAYRPDGLQRRIALLREVLALAAETSTPQVELAARGLLVSSLLEAAAVEEADAELAAAMEVARRPGHASSLAQLLLLRATRVRMAGDLEAAEAALAEAAAHLERTGLPALASTQAIGWFDLRLQAGRLPEIAGLVTDVIAPATPISPAEYLALLHAQAGRPEEGRRLLLEQGAVPLPWDWRWLGWTSLRALAVAETGALELAPGVVDALAPYAGRLGVAGQLSVIRPVDLLLGRLRTALGDPAGAEDLQRALATCERHGFTRWADEARAALKGA